ncbi:MAG: hypothetical protein E7289_01725 [Lachnospiraceae bacterium]|nr:hypothetical protein [Lachnospiraceae bacterium]
MEHQSIEQIIYEETEKRLAVMEEKDYEFPEKIGKGDVIAIAVSIAVSMLLVVLCMTGGIV